MAEAAAGASSAVTDISLTAADPAAPWLRSIKANTPTEVLSLWSLPRKDAEDLYRQAWIKEDRDALRWFCLNDRYFLLTTVLRRPDLADMHTRDWVFLRTREVEADPDDHVDLWAREHYKSTIITFAGVIQEILKDPEITIGIFSHDKPAAKDFLNQIKIELEENKALKLLFPEICWKEPGRQAKWWSLDEGIVVKRHSNPKEATVECSGLIDGMSTGKHFKLRVYDDIVTEETVNTAEMIAKTTNRFELSENLGTRDGRCWIVGTRYHYGDTYGQLLERGAWTERRYPATHDGTFDGRPVFLTQKQWDDRKKRQSKGTIASQMLLNPLEGAEVKFDVRWLGFWVVRPKRMMIYIMCDPSKGPHVDSDRTAMAVIGYDVNRNKYLVGGYCHRMQLSRRWILIRDLYKNWSRTPGVDGVRVGYEQYGMQTDLEYFEERMEAEQFYFPIDELAWPRQGPGSKEKRIERLEPDFRGQRLRLPAVITFDKEGRKHSRDPYKEKIAQQAIDQKEEWRVAKPIKALDEDKRIYDLIDRFVEEYMFFPFGPRRDFLDAMSRIYDMDPAPPGSYDRDAQGNSLTEPEVFADS